MHKGKEEIRNTLRKFSDDIRTHLDDIIDSYKIEGREISKLINQKVNFNKENQFYKYYLFLSKKTFEYDAYFKKIVLEEEKNNHVYNLLKKFMKYQQSFICLKIFLEKNDLKFLKKIEKNTISQLLKEVELLNEDLMFLITVKIGRDFNNFLDILLKFQSLKKNILKYISKILNLYYKNISYKLNPIYKNLKKIKLSDLKEGDIILLDEKDMEDTTVRKLIKYYTNSNLIHSAIVFSPINTYKKEVFLFQANGVDFKSTNVNPFKFEKDGKYILLRYRKKLKKTDIEKIRRKIDLYRGVKFSDLKLFAIALNYTFEKLWGNVPLITKGKNIYFGNALFCSELIVRLYEELDIFLGFEVDPAMISPVDFFNCIDLDVVGYLD